MSKEYSKKTNKKKKKKEDVMVLLVTNREETFLLKHLNYVQKITKSEIGVMQTVVVHEINEREITSLFNLAQSIKVNIEFEISTEMRNLEIVTIKGVNSLEYVRVRFILYILMNKLLFLFESLFVSIKTLRHPDIKTRIGYLTERRDTFISEIDFLDKHSLSDLIESQRISYNLEEVINMIGYQGQVERINKFIYESSDKIIKEIKKLKEEDIALTRAKMFHVSWDEELDSINKREEEINNLNLSNNNSSNKTDAFSEFDDVSKIKLDDFTFDDFNSVMFYNSWKEITTGESDSSIKKLDLTDELKEMALNMGNEDQLEMEAARELELMKEVEPVYQRERKKVFRNNESINYNLSEVLRNSINTFVKTQNFNHVWELPNFDVENYQYYMDSFSSLLEESYVRNIYASNGWMPGTQRDVERINDLGKKFTPDYILIKGNEVIYVEFKFRFGVWSPQMISDVENGVNGSKGTKEKYGDEVLVVFLEGDHNYIKRNFSSSIYLDPLVKMLQLITTLRPLIPRYSPLRNYKLGISQMDQWEKILEDTKDYFSRGIVLSCENNREEESENLVHDTILNLRNMGKWIRDNVLFSEDMMDYFNTFVGGNINPKYPFSRDKSLIFSKKHNRIHNHGNKAKNLFMCPQYLVNYDISNSDVRELIEEDPPIVFIIYDIYSRLVEKNKDGIIRLRQIQKTIAFVEGTATNDVIGVISLDLFGEKVGRFQLLELLYTQKNSILEKLNEDIHDDRESIKRQDLIIKLSKRDNLVFKSDVLFKRAFGYKNKNKDSVSKEMSEMNIKLKELIKKRKESTDEFENSRIDEEILEVTIEIRSAETGNLFRSRLDYEDAFKVVERDLENVEVNPNSKPSLEDLRGAYKGIGNESLEELADQSIEIAENILEEIINSKYCRMTFSYYQLLETIKGNVNQPHTKYMDRKSFKVFQCPHTKVYVIATPSPSKDISPALIFFGKVKIEDSSSASADFLLDIKTKNVGNFCYWWNNKPCRLPWTTVRNSLKLKWGSILTAAYTLELESDLYQKALFWSLYWNFSRSIKFCLDAVYLVLKGSFQMASFGKEKANEELNALVTNDVRCSSIMYRMKANFKEFAIKSYRSSLSKYNQQNYLIDPIFGSKITGWQMLLAVIYIRMIYDKDDESDVIQLYDKAIQKELGLKEDYMNSKGFNYTYKKIDEQKDVNDFMEKLFPNGYDNKWVKLAYLPSAILKYGRNLAKSAKEGTSIAKSHEYINSPVLNTGKNSTVMVGGNMFRLVEMRRQDHGYGVMKEKLKNAHQERFQLPGLKSEKLDIALIKNYFAIKDIVMNNGKTMNDKELVTFIREKLFKNINNVSSFFENDNQISLGVSSIIDILIQGGNIIVRMKDKKESKYNRRVFFIQMIGNKTSNQVFDTFYRPLLTCEENTVDIISKGGNKKILALQAKNKKFNMKKNSMSCATDITRFGDQVLSEAMFVLNKALRLENFLTENEYIYFSYLISILQNRKIILPTEMQQAILKETNGSYKIDSVKAGKWYSHYKSGPLAAALNDPQNDLGLEGPLLKEVKWCLKISRKNGGTLGVFNICWSVLSSMYVLMQKDIMKELFVNPIVMEGSTMSDDNLTQTIFELPSREAFLRDDLIGKFIDEFYLKGKRILIDGKNYFSIDRRTKEKVHLNLSANPDLKDCIAMTYLSTAILCPRMFSWLISPLKTTFGAAAEIMQDVITNSGNFFVPIVRYVTSMFVELTGENPTYDTMNSVSKIYDILVNGGSTNTVNMGFILANTMVSERFGLKDRKIGLPVQLNGLYYIYPDLMITTGFDGNTLRLLQISENNPVLERILATLIDSPEIFRQKRTSQQIATEDNVKMDAINKRNKMLSKTLENIRGEINKDDIWDTTGDLINSINKDLERVEMKLAEESEKIGDVVINREEEAYEQNNVRLGLWAVFSIKFNRSILAKSAYQEFKHRVRKEIEDFAKRNRISYSNDDDLEDKVIQEVGLLSSLKSSSNLLAVVNQLGKMRKPNYADLFGKMGVDYLMIARWGYPDRIVNNPFSDRIKEKMKIKESYMSVRDVFGYIIKIAENANEEDIKRSMTMIKIMKNVNKSQLSIFGIGFTYEIRDRIVPLEEDVFRGLNKEERRRFFRTDNDGFEDTKTIYIDTGNDFEGVKYSNTEMQLAISLLREKKVRSDIEVKKKKNPNAIIEIHDMDTLAYRLFPSIVITKDFQECVKFVRMHFLQLGIIEPSDMNKYSRTFLQMLTPSEFKGIYKRGFENNFREEEHLLYDHSKFFFSFRKKLYVTYTGENSTYKFRSGRRNDISFHYEANNILICCLWAIEFGIISPDIFLEETTLIMNNGSDVKTDLVSEDSLIEVLFKIDLKRLGEWASCVYTKFLMLKSLYRFSFIVSAKKIQDENNQGGMLKIYFFQYRDWPSVSIVMDKGSRNTNKFKIYITNGNTPNTMNPWEYAKSIAFFITRIFGISSEFFSGISSLKDSPEIMMFDNILQRKVGFKFGNLKHFPNDLKRPEISEKNDRHSSLFLVKEFHILTTRAFKDRFVLNIGVLDMRVSSVGVSYKIKNEKLFEDNRIVGSYLVTPWSYSNNGFGCSIVVDSVKIMEDLYIAGSSTDMPVIISENTQFSYYSFLNNSFILDEMMVNLNVEIYSSNLQGMTPNVQKTKMIRRFEEQTLILYKDLSYIVDNSKELNVLKNVEELVLPDTLEFKKFEMWEKRKEEISLIDIKLKSNILRSIVNKANQIVALIRWVSSRNSFKIRGISTLRIYLIGFVLRHLISVSINEISNKMQYENEKFIIEYRAVIMTRCKKLNLVNNVLEELKSQLGVSLFKGIDGLVNNNMSFTIILQSKVLVNEENLADLKLKVFEFVDDRGMEILEERVLKLEDTLFEDLSGLVPILSEMRNINERCWMMGEHFTKTKEIESLDKIVFNIIQNERFDPEDFGMMNSILKTINIYFVKGVNNVDPFIIETVLRNNMLDPEYAQLIRVSYNTFFVKEEMKLRSYKKHHIIYDKLILSFIFERVINSEKMKLQRFWDSISVL